MPRICNACQKKMNKGFVIDDGVQYFCTEDCLYTEMTKAEYLELYDDGEGTSYWTEWEEEEQEVADLQPTS